MAGSPFYRAFVRLVPVQILRQVLEGAEVDTLLYKSFDSGSPLVGGVHDSATALTGPCRPSGHPCRKGTDLSIA